MQPFVKEPTRLVLLALSTILLPFDCKDYESTINELETLVKSIPKSYFFGFQNKKEVRKNGLSHLDLRPTYTDRSTIKEKEASQRNSNAR